MTAAIVASNPWYQVASLLGFSVIGAYQENEYRGSLRLLAKMFVLVCLPAQESWDCAWNDSDALCNVFKPIGSGVDHSLSKFFSARIIFAIEVDDFRNFF